MTRGSAFAAARAGVRWRARIVTFAASSALLFSSACRDSDRDAQKPIATDDRPGGVASEPPTTAAIAIDGIPQPPTADVEPAVRELLEGARRRIEKAAGAGCTRAERAKAFGAAAMAYHTYRYDDAALACYRVAREAAPQEIRWRYLPADIHRRLGDETRARELFESVLERRPDDLPTRLRLGELYFDCDDLEHASAQLERALAIDAKCYRATFGLARIAAKRSDFERAIALFQRVLAAVPDATAVHYPLGLAYRQVGRDELARQHLERRGRVMPPLSDPFIEELDALRIGSRLRLNRGGAHFASGRFELARIEFQAAVDADPADPTALANLGLTLLRLKDIDGATKRLKEALAQDSKHVKANVGYGELLAKLGRDEQAIRYYEVALAGDPGLRPARFNLANALWRLGQNQESIAAFRAVIELQPTDIEARLGEILNLVKLRRFAEALERAEAAYAFAPDNPRVQQVLGRLLAAAPGEVARDGQRALELARSLWESNRSLLHLELMAMALAEVGRFDEAVKLQRAGIEAANGKARPDLAKQLERNLDRYSARKPCREPWEPDSATLTPKNHRS